LARLHLKFILLGLVGIRWTTLSFLFGVKLYLNRLFLLSFTLHFLSFHLFVALCIIINQALQESKLSLIDINTAKEIFSIDPASSLVSFLQLFQKELTKILDRFSHSRNGLCLGRIILILFHNGFDSIKWKEKLIILIFGLWIGNHFIGLIEIIPE
jgi:hypothetical protein